MVAEVDGGQLGWFNLSRTCPAKPTPGTATDHPTTGGTSTGETGASPTPSTGSLGGSSGGTSGSSSASPTGSSGPASGSLAETGPSATTGWLGGAAVVLLTGDGFMVLRRRKAGQHSQPQHP